MVGTINFVLRTQKILKNGKAPIYLTYSIHRVRIFNALNKQSIYPDYWDSESQRATYIPQREAKKLLPHLSPNDLLTESEINEINKEIDKATAKIESIEDKLKANNIPFSSEMVIEQLKANDAVNPKTKKEEIAGLLYNFMDQYIADHSATREAGSLTVYKSVKNHLQAYQEATGHKVTFEGIDYSCKRS